MSSIFPDWDFSLLDGFIQARGDDVIVETGIACPCRNGDQYAGLIMREGRPANQARLNCPQCKGDTFIYRNQRRVRGLVTSVHPVRDKQLIETGFALPGDMTFSPELSADTITDMDRITLLYPSDVSEGQVIMRASHTLEDNQFITTDLEPNEDRLWYEATCSIWCEDINGVVYNQGSDFRFENKKIVWIGNTPSVGTLYTVKYKAYLEWTVFSGGMERIDNCRSIGQQIILRKKHVAFLTESPNESLENREIEFSTSTSI